MAMDMSPLWWLVPLAVAAVLVIPFAERRRLRKARQDFVAAHGPLPDEEFLQETGATKEQARVCLALRGVLAEEGKVPPEFIHPEDTLQALFLLQFDGGDVLGTLFHLEKKLGVQLSDRELPRLDDTKTFGEFAMLLADRIQGAAPVQAESKPPPER